MADDNNPQDPPQDPTPEPVKPDLGEAGKKALDDERRAKRAAEKRATELETELDKLRKANQSDQERLLDEAKRSAADEAAEPLRREVARLTVALEKGLTAGQAKRLVGATPEELAADADELLAEFGGGQPPQPRRPAPDPSQGARGPADEPADKSPRGLIAFGLQKTADARK